MRQSAAPEETSGDARKWCESSLIGLLDPHREVAGFAGRSAELGELLAWCADGQDAPVRLVIGPSGVGKTRLAVEFAHRMRARGWRTDWLDQVRPEIPAAWIVQRKSLVIIDAADDRDGLAGLLVDLVALQPQARILLLARDAGAWCDQAELAGPAPHALITAARLALIELTAEVDADLSGEEITALAGVAFAAELGLPSRSLGLARSGEPGHPLVLGLHIAALAGTVRATSEPVHLDSAPALLLALEQEFWDHSAEQAGIEADPDLLSRLATAGLLLGASTEEQAAAAVAAAVAAAGANGTDADEESALAGWLPEILGTWPWPLARLQAAAELSAAPDFARRCLSDLGPAQLRRVLPLLTGEAKASPPESARRLVASQLEQLTAPNSELIPLLDAVPYPDAIWAEAGAALCGLIVRQLPADTDLGTRAYWLNTLSARLWLAGRQLEAVASAEEAVTLRRDLAADAPERYLASLAVSLSYLGIQYAGLGRADDALKVTEEAVSVRRRLAADDPERYAQLAQLADEQS